MFLPKKKVAIVAMARTTRDQAPWDDPDWEIWGINEAYRLKYMKRWDRWFQLHPHWNFSREKNPNDPRHMAWLRSRPAPGEPGFFPIYMQEHFEDVPASVKYPLDEVLEMLKVRYINSTVSAMIALAIYEERPEIALYGIEMGTNTEYWYQRPGGEFMLGFALARGIAITIPKECLLLKGKLYGWEAIPMIGRQELEAYFKGVREREKAEMGQYNCMLGAMQETQDQLGQIVNDEARAPLEKRIQELTKEIPMQKALLHQIIGGRMVLADLINRIDMQEPGGRVPDASLDGDPLPLLNVSSATPLEGAQDEQPPQSPPPDAGGGEA